MYFGYNTYITFDDKIQTICKVSLIGVLIALQIIFTIIGMGKYHKNIGNQNDSYSRSTYWSYNHYFTKDHYTKINDFVICRLLSIPLLLSLLIVKIVYLFDKYLTIKL